MAARPVSPRSRAKQEQVRAAAQKLFLANGVAGTSMDAITAEAGVSKQTVYAHFASKEALLYDVLRTLVSRGSGVWEAHANSGTPPRSRAELEARLEQLALTIIDTLMAQDYLATVRVIITECARDPQLGELFRQAVSTPVLEAVGGLLAQGAAAGLVRDEDPQEAARLLIGPLITFVLLDGLLRPGEARRPEPARVAALVRMAVAGLATR